MLPPIITKYLGPTNTKGARVVATWGGQIRKTVPWDYELDACDNHMRAAERVIADLHEVTGCKWFVGTTSNGYVLVCDHSRWIRRHERGTDRSVSRADERNYEGLSWGEWLAAATLGGKPVMPGMKASWENGEDPAEWAAR